MRVYYNSGFIKEQRGPFLRASRAPSFSVATNPKNRTLSGSFVTADSQIICSYTHTHTTALLQVVMKTLKGRILIKRSFLLTVVYTFIYIYNPTILSLLHSLCISIYIYIYLTLLCRRRFLLSIPHTPTTVGPSLLDNNTAPTSQTNHPHRRRRRRRSFTVRVIIIYINAKRNQHYSRPIASRRPRLENVSNFLPSFRP